MHNSWQTLIGLIEQIANQYGGTVYDKETGRTWDAGQALCREVYGVDWMTNPEFREADSHSPEEPAPQSILETAQNWISGQVPEWVQIE